MSQQTLINGNRYSFTSVTVNMAGLESPRGVFKSISYDASCDPGVVQGNRITVVGLTTGYGTGSGSFEMLIAELDDFFAAITAGGTFPITSVDFNVIVSYSVNGIDNRTDTLEGCRIVKISSPNQQGNDASTKSCDLFIRQQYINGIAVYADPQF